MNTRAVQAAFSATLGTVPYPLLSDFWPHGEVVDSYGILNEENGLSRRSVILVDKRGVIRFKRVYESAADLHVEDVLAEVNKL